MWNQDLDSIVISRGPKEDTSPGEKLSLRLGQVVLIPGLAQVDLETMPGEDARLQYPIFWCYTTKCAAQHPVDIRYSAQDYAPTTVLCTV